MILLILLWLLLHPPSNSHQCQLYPQSYLSLASSLEGFWMSLEGLATAAAKMQVDCLIMVLHSFWNLVPVLMLAYT
jgi:hypothetical protein